MQGSPFLTEMHTTRENPPACPGDVEAGRATTAPSSRSGRQFRRYAKNVCVQVLFISLRELFGTAVFTFVACVFNGDRFSIGITYTILQASAEISRAGGLHLNPVISLAVAISGKIRKPLIILPMILAQFTGCLLGAGLCLGSMEKVLFISGTYGSRTPWFSLMSVVEEKTDLVKYCLGELLLTSMLVTVFLHLFPLKARSLPANENEAREVENRKLIHALFVGLALVGLTGTWSGSRFFIGVMNPFQVFGPMAVRVATMENKVENTVFQSNLDTPNTWKGHWVHWVGPILGGVIAGVVDRLKGFCETRL